MGGGLGTRLSLRFGGSKVAPANRHLDIRTRKMAPKILHTQLDLFRSPSSFVRLLACLSQSLPKWTVLTARLCLRHLRPPPPDRPGAGWRPAHLQQSQRPDGDLQYAALAQSWISFGKLTLSFCFAAGNEKREVRGAGERVAGVLGRLSLATGTLSFSN